MVNTYLIRKRFWMVFVEGRQSPATEFQSVEDARKEAQRLCVKENRNAFVLEAVNGYYLPEPECGMISMRDEVSDEE